MTIYGITSEEIEYMRKTVQNVYGNRENAVWQKAFKAYNSNSGNRALDMGCRGCYGKVLHWLIQQVIQNTTPTGIVFDIDKEEKQDL